MGRIIQIKEEDLVGGSSTTPIYPVTSGKAVYLADGFHVLKEIEEIENGNKLQDQSISTRHITDGNVTPLKLSSEVFEQFGKQVVVVIPNYGSLEITYDASTGFLYLEASEQTKYDVETDEDDNIIITLY